MMVSIKLIVFSTLHYTMSSQNCKSKLTGPPSNLTPNDALLMLLEKTPY